MFLLKEHPNTTQRQDGKLQPGDVKITMTIGARHLLEGELQRPISNPPLLTHGDFIQIWQRRARRLLTCFQP